MFLLVVLPVVFCRRLSTTESLVNEMFDLTPKGLKGLKELTPAKTEVSPCRPL